MVVGYSNNATVDDSKITSIYSDFFTNINYLKYYDKYTSPSYTSYNNRLLGDATGEIGPFGSEKDQDEKNRYKGSWYKDMCHFLYPSAPWLIRGGAWYNGNGAGIFSFVYAIGATHAGSGYRIVLTPNN